MAFDQTVYDSHLRAAGAAHNPLARYDALWKAFNHFYESLYVPSDGRNPKEHELIHRAVGQIPAHRLVVIMRAADGSGIADISLVFDERMWSRFGHRAHGRHEKVRALLGRHGQRDATSRADVEQIADLLYVIRCNAAHGFKAPDGPRDAEVLGAATPVLEALIAALPVGIEDDASGAAQAG